MASFDVVSEIDDQEIGNAIDQASRELAQRYDFRDTQSSIELSDKEITLASISEDRLNAIKVVLEEKMVRRKVSLKALSYGEIEPAAGGTVRLKIALVAGISSDKAKEINKFIKALGHKGVQSQTQGEQVRVTAKKRDILQDIIASLKDSDLDIPLQFENFRS
ncbi:MAG: YajQ family cyclic di-GMP-binding protein [Actinobacteria bacterium]|nr:YajQ family cyclic di-GMP-binding protein [Actinomycetota bacterium]